MANISIADLNLSGSVLFIDSESFMNELTDNEMRIEGGKYGNPGNIPTTVEATGNTLYLIPSLRGDVLVLD
ncbi:MAG: hypothetical protein MUD14_00250 [Hydrococcus sp. Prado102]|jgi:hypothetical protein|nr:hypothetical protein [Hydrococcus sp. Prado102]